MKNKNIFVLAALLCTTSGCSSRQFEGHEHNSDTEAVKAAIHGMVVFGTNTIYASHIPMFSAPHDFQALFEIEMSHPKQDAKALYRKQIVAEKQVLITIKPEPFVLPDLITGNITSFKTAMFSGNHEQNGKLLLSDVTIKVKKVIFKKMLSTKTPPLSKLTYFVLKDRQDVFLVHRITAPSNFDQIIQVNSSIPSDNLPFEIEIDARKDIVTERLSAKSVVTIEKPKVTFSGVSAFYCLVGNSFTKNCP